jgi:ketosteroid isomerase-like protein
MAGSNEQLLRDAYAIFAKGDIEGFFALCTPGITFHIPGNTPLSGHHTGKEAFLPILGKVMEISGGTFQEEVHDVTTSDTHGTALLLHRFERNGKPVEYNTAHVWHIADGKLSEFWELPVDQAEYEAAWG